MTFLLTKYGVAGSGKSILSSTAIEYLLDKYDAKPDTALAYFYFNFGTVKTHDVSVMLCSIIKQLCSRRPNIPSTVDSFFSYVDKGQRPTVAKLEEALCACMHGFSVVHLVLDGLDEVPTLLKQRKAVLNSLCRIMDKAPKNVSTMCTSRNEADIERSFSRFFTPSSGIKFDLADFRHEQKSDMAVHIDKVLSSGICADWEPDLKEYAKKKVLDRADGM